MECDTAGPVEAAVREIARLLKERKKLREELADTEALLDYRIDRLRVLEGRS
jgi:aryl carrier-like protein